MAHFQLCSPSMQPGHWVHVSRKSLWLVLLHAAGCLPELQTGLMSETENDFVIRETLQWSSDCNFCPQLSLSVVLRCQFSCSQCRLHLSAALQQQSRQAELEAKSAQADDIEMQHLAERLQQAEATSSELQTRLVEQVFQIIMQSDCLHIIDQRNPYYRVANYFRPYNVILSLQRIIDVCTFDIQQGACSLLSKR